MRWYHVAALGAAWATAAAAPANGQERDVARQQFTFIGTALEVYVDVEVGGSLQIIRGDPGTVHVTSRSRAGFTDASLSDRGELTLAAAGPGPVHYVVSVPDRVRVTVRLPGQTLPESIGSWNGGRTFEWAGRATSGTAPGGEEAPSKPGPTASLPQTTGQPGTSLFTTYLSATPPRTVSVPDLSNVRSITVRLGESGFRIEASRPLSVSPGDPRAIEIRPAGPPVDLVIALPAGVTTFTLRAGGHTALILDGNRIATLCSPMTDQRLSRGRRWITFTPEDSKLRCSSASGSRHEG